ncbi:MAG: hypothetical protein L3J23_01375 [Flavobacteriaceae bacterium]|nr:hypothetical protein [Flavobacteriaceae bacterium]
MKKILSLLLIVLFAFTVHKYHLSLTKIVFNVKSNSLQITMHCFIDDIESVINKTENVTCELATKREVKNIDSLLQKYVLSNFILKVNQKKQLLKYIGKEYEKDLIYFYLETDSVPKINFLEVQNKILLNTFDDQQNIIKINLNSQKKTFYLKNGNDKEMLKFDK